ncbi:glycerol-3-phosphate dehydrogenase/oxidase [Niallia endozanthoxylica]|uniref:Glycerol-3-phosphate dehydrogenase n=1 Tax=Niallia endozanthoxylica TaxID=2036016 RepID=A0A5J5HA52_9BACI|nr:glycerol-3-phosphate dehydrogenase/oxidase [Niallia endozanthoxylica]KAA9016452.1 glycerol-3-phosphate dehydrogenase/oxidase [Niallia endozanthoxylica]
MMSETFSSLNRKQILEKMEHQEFDLLIIGGGITGAGIALDAASRGMKTALVEMQDFAAGTSSRSTKLIHGGLRYLKKFELKLVSEVGRERAIVYDNGPHVTTPLKMLIPVYKNTGFGIFATSMGLRLYDFLAGVKKSERCRMLSKEEMLILEPKLKKDGLLGGGLFVEYRSDDARLTIEVLKEAASQGALVMNYAKVTNFIYQNEKLAGVYIEDQLDGQQCEIHAKKIVNAAGPWVDRLREQDRSLLDKHLFLTKGIHLVFDQSVFPLQQALYFDTPDGRMVLMIPRDGKTYVGTTDTPYNGDLTNPRMTVSDCDYLLDTIHYIFPDLNIQANDIESSWAGVRPLIHEPSKGPSEISRKDEIWTSPSGLISIAGGKLTGYRKMAEKIVDTLAKEFHKEAQAAFPPCQTKRLPISGGSVGGAQNFPAFIEKKLNQGLKLGLNTDEAYLLIKRYGSNIDDVYEIMEKNKNEAEASELPLALYAQVMYSLENEYAYTPVDFFLRRTGALLFQIQWVKKWRTPVIELMSQKLGWSAEKKEQFHLELEKQIQNLTDALESDI